MKNFLNKDAISTIGVNIATGIIVESIIESKLNNKYSNWYVNIDTLIKNYLSCLDGDTSKRISIMKLNKNQITKEIATEIAILNDKLNSLDIKLYIYRCNYKKVKDIYKNWRELDSFKGYKYTLFKTIEDIYNLIKDNDIIHKGNYIVKIPKKTLLTTHYSVDIFNIIKDDTSALIESHTGELKTKNKYYTKFYKLPNKDMSVIPFTQRMLYIMGDKYFIKPLNIKLRNLIYDLALKNKWRYNTIENKWLFDLKHKDNILYRQIKDIKRPYYIT